MTVEFTLLGPPVAKGRPKFSRQGSFVKAYTPKKTVDYETLVRFSYIEASENKMFPEGKALTVRIRAFLPIPKSVSKKKALDMKKGLISHIKKPDTDNIVKSVMDGLNTIAFHDDSQVTRILAEKSYSDVPRIEVLITDEEGIFTFRRKKI